MIWRQHRRDEWSTRVFDVTLKGNPDHGRHSAGMDDLQQRTSTDSQNQGLQGPLEEQGALISLNLSVLSETLGSPHTCFFSEALPVIIAVTAQNLL